MIAVGINVLFQDHDFICRALQANNHFTVQIKWDTSVWLLFVAFKLKWINLEENYLNIDVYIHQCLAIQFDLTRIKIVNGICFQKRQTNSKPNIFKKTIDDNILSLSIGKNNTSAAYNRIWIILGSAFFSASFLATHEKRFFGKCTQTLLK